MSPIRNQLSTKMSIAQFDNGYWYADEIKAFAKKIGIENSSLLRKDELENLIKHFLTTGKIQKPSRKNVLKAGIKDLDKGLSLKLPVINYTSNKQTKDFIVKEAFKISPEMKMRSGARYRLNRWRDDQVTKGVKITYGDLVKKYIDLNKPEVKFRKAPSGRYINFLSDYLANEKTVSRKQGIIEWKKLKKLDTPKDYSSWKKLQK
ncbi:SAP domain-containing protein [soil metagenome]